MTPEEIKRELQDKIKEFERQSRLISLEVITWLQDLIKRIDEVKPVKEPLAEKEVKVELKEEKETSKTKWKSKWK